MPTPHLDKTLNALAEPWFFQGNLGLQCANVLRQKLQGRSDKQSIDNARSLGGYLLHVDSQ